MPVKRCESLPQNAKPIWVLYVRVTYRLYIPFYPCCVSVVSVGFGGSNYPVDWTICCWATDVDGAAAAVDIFTFSLPLLMYFLCVRFFLWLVEHTLRVRGGCARGRNLHRNCAMTRTNARCSMHLFADVSRSTGNRGRTGRNRVCVCVCHDRLQCTQSGTFLRKHAWGWHKCGKGASVCVFFCVCAGLSVPMKRSCLLLFRKQHNQKHLITHTLIDPPALCRDVLPYIPVGNA